MKKVISVMILLSFFASMIIMTGCFGGDNGIGAVLGGVLILAIVASSGSAAVPVFAANTRMNLRPAAITGTDKEKVTMKIIPIKDGDEQTATIIPSTGIEWVGDQIKANPSVNQYDGFNEYRIQVMYDNKPILENAVYVKTADKTGSKNVEVNATSTAKLIVYDQWKNNSTTTDSYKVFEDNFIKNTIESSPNFLTVANNVKAALNDPQNINYSTAITNAANVNVPETIYYSISGYIKTADGLSGQSDATVYLYTKEPRQMQEHVMSSNGNYSFDSVVNGTYIVFPQKADHTYTPQELEVVVNGADVTSVNFQAQTQAFGASSR
jgi:hypothetical protein